MSEHLCAARRQPAGVTVKPCAASFSSENTSYSVQPIVSVPSGFAVTKPVTSAWAAAVR